MKSEVWKRLVDLDRLATWMDARGLGEGPVEDPLPLSGGTQNVLLKFRRGEKSYVLRRPPSHTQVDGTATMRREARILAALASTRVPHPRLIAASDDQTILGAGFYLMEPVDGFTPTVGLPDVFLANAGYCHRIGLAMAGAIAELAQIDPLAIGLSDLARLDGYLERQVVRWRSQLAGYGEYQGWPGPDNIHGLDVVTRWLERNIPGQFVPGIVHGDFHLGNVMFDRERPELSAIVDWELASLGDPLLDLGELIATWPDAEGQGIAPQVEVRPWVGFANSQELIAHYFTRAERDVGPLRWFIVLACFRLAAILEGTHARACAGKASSDVGAQLHTAALRLTERARSWIERYDIA
ncbi:phosphotransferase family protein [Bradyrhizobium tropiciagri]|uniref:phosphotransferase family protein n=1 Tax=Bradyrhizobium tropiciagri TaxID=312253 RepID=UPI001BA7D253|nr:phosphotransferase family protein [Bradyrhizobium tropiciagri]MBR0898941.1 phosphotransferase family protein [Bradyrhizobium tropiciagri]